MLGIVILNFNTAEDVKVCIKSIRRTARLDYKVYVVDNHSHDDSYRILQEYYRDAEDVAVLAAEKNGGYSYGNNIGIHLAEKDGCDYILISNPDIIFEPGAINIMLKTLQMDKRIGVSAPSVKTPGGIETQLLSKPLTVDLYLFHKNGLNQLAKRLPNFCKEYPVPRDHSKVYLFNGMVRGCCFMIPTELMRKLGYFDENVFLYEEESILGRKMVNLGKKAAVNYQARVIHNESSSTSISGDAFQKYHYYLSALYYLKIYGEAGTPMLVFVALLNLASFTVKAIGSKDYRRLYRSFFRQSIRLLMTGGNPNLPGNKIDRR